MSYDYEALFHQTPDALGAPTPAVLDAFDQHIPKGVHVLDIGCVQGRDALVLGRLGYRVTGVDISRSGIRDLNQAALRENLPVTGHVADLHGWDPQDILTEPVGVLLCDRTLHMLRV